MMAYLDGIPVGPLVLFGLGWLAFLGLVLLFIRSRRSEVCDRCGGRWQRTERGTLWHFCQLSKKEYP
jgi:hypothetical protein